MSAPLPFATCIANPDGGVPQPLRRGVHAPLPSARPAKRLHKVRYFGSGTPANAPLPATPDCSSTCNVPNASRHSPSPAPSLPAPAINPPSRLSVCVQTAASVISSSSASSCQNSPKDRDRMPRCAPLVTRACPTRHALLLPASRSLTKFARQTHPRAPREPLPRPAPSVPLSPFRAYCSMPATRRHHPTTEISRRNATNCPAPASPNRPFAPAARRKNP